MTSTGSTAAVEVLRVTEELDVATVPALRRRLDAALERRPQTLALDLSVCPFAGIDAIDLLVQETESALRQGTTLVLVGLAPVTRRAARVLGVETSLRFAETRRPLAARSPSAT